MLKKSNSFSDEECNLNIRFGKFEDDIFQIDDYFYDNDYREWLKDPLVSEIIEDIDECTHLAGSAFEGDQGAFSIFEVSTGAKAVILMLKRPDLIIDATRCGDNCAPWIVKVSEKHPITITLRYVMEWGDCLKKFRDLNNNKVYEGMLGFRYAYSEYWRNEVCK